MRSLVPKLFVAALLVLAALVPASAAAAPTYSGSFKVSGTDANNVKIATGPDGNLWMTLSGSTNDVAKITPAGAVTEYDLPEITASGGIAAGPEGMLWVTVNGGAARFSPDDPIGTAEEFLISAEIKANASIVAGPEGRMWIATEGRLVSFPPAEAGTVKSEFGIEDLTPHDIDVAGPRLVIADGGNGRIVTFEPGALPKTDKVDFVRNPIGTAQGVAGNPNGQIAFSESDGEEGLALATPPSAATSIAHKGDPFGVALGSDGAYYFAMSQDDDVQRLTPNGELSTISGFPPKFFPRQITGGPDNTVWVVMEIPGGNTVEVARITGLEPPVTTPSTPANVVAVTTKSVPDTTLKARPKKVLKIRSPRTTVRFGFTSTTPGSTFQCKLTRPVNRKTKKKPKPAVFTSCASPLTYHYLVPGRYRFAVRAVAAGAADPSPAEAAFRVVHVPPHR